MGSIIIVCVVYDRENDLQIFNFIMYENMGSKVHKFLFFLPIKSKPYHKIGYKKSSGPTL